MVALAFRALLLCSLALAVGCSKRAPQAVENTNGTSSSRSSLELNQFPESAVLTEGGVLRRR
jgi:hypothetical protein